MHALRAGWAEAAAAARRSGEVMVCLKPIALREVLAPLVARLAPTARVVLNAAGNTPSRQATLTALRKLQTVHGLPARSYHSLRHAFCSSLVRAGASVEAVRVLAGHSKLDVTQRYAHASGADLAATIALLH